MNYDSNRTNLTNFAACNSYYIQLLSNMNSIWIPRSVKNVIVLNNVKSVCLKVKRNSLQFGINVKKYI